MALIASAIVDRREHQLELIHKVGNRSDSDDRYWNRNLDTLCIVLIMREGSYGSPYNFNLFPVALSPT